MAVKTKGFEDFDFSSLFESDNNAVTPIAVMAWKNTFIFCLVKMPIAL